MLVRFRGVRGSTPTPQSENLKFGGNTPCVEIRTSAGGCFIFDAGSGIRRLGQLLTDEAAGEPIHANIFLTHFHWDHIQGIPYFAPIFEARNSVTFHSGRSGSPLQKTLEGQMVQPYFPIEFARTPAQRSFREMEANETLEVGGALIRSFPLNHPQGASGYRIECDRSAVVYATDYEHGNPALDATLLEQSQNADILICDTQYTPEEYESHHGWGHSTWRHAAALAHEAGVKQLVLFHHDPDHDDHEMARIQTNACAEFGNTVAAREDLTISL